MIDLISRQDVIKMIQKTEEMYPYKVPGNRDSYGKYAEAWNDATCLIEAQMAFISSVIVEDTERKKGRWIEYPDCLGYGGAYSDDHIVCSECEHVFSILDNCTEEFDFCPNCGADMRGER